MVSDITADYAALDCTDDPPINACDYPASKAVITGPAAIGGVDCNTWTTDALTAYGRRCHLLTGLTPGDTDSVPMEVYVRPRRAIRGLLSG